MSDWQPIESAPKTPQSILVWCASNRCTYVVAWGEGAWQVMGGAELLREPTHWMPLPAPPKVEA